MLPAKEDMSIEWSHFSEAVASDLWQFYNSNDYSDVTIYTDDGHQIKSHRIVLAMCSDYFRDLFQKNQTPNCISKFLYRYAIYLCQIVSVRHLFMPFLLFSVCLPNMSSGIVQKIFTLIYAGLVKLPQSEMQKFVDAAKYLKLKGFDELQSEKSSNVLDNAPNNGQSSQQRNVRETYSIRLRRIDDDILNMPKSSNGIPAKSLPDLNSVISSTDRREGTTTMECDPDKFFPDDLDSSFEENSPPAADVTNGNLSDSSDNGNTNYYTRKVFTDSTHR